MSKSQSGDIFSNKKSLTICGGDMEGMRLKMPYSVQPPFRPLLRLS